MRVTSLTLTAILAQSILAQPQNQPRQDVESRQHIGPRQHVERQSIETRQRVEPRQHVERRQRVSAWSRLQDMVLKRSEPSDPARSLDDSSFESANNTKTFQEKYDSSCPDGSCEKPSCPEKPKPCQNKPCQYHEKPKPCQNNGKPCNHEKPTKSCLDNHTAKKLADTFEYFFINLDAQVATAVLTEDFQYISDSDNTLKFDRASVLPGLPTYSSRAAFISGLPSDQFRAAPDPYVVEDIFHSCHKVAYRWVVPGGFTPPMVPAATIRGITILETRNNGSFYRIERAHTEYNNLLTAADANRCDVCSKIGLPS